MKDIYKDLYKTIEKIVNLRIEDIIEKGDFNEKTKRNIKNTNEIIVKDINKDIKIIKGRKRKNNSSKILTGYTCFVKDASNIIKNEPSLKYLPNDIILKIETYKNKSAKEQFKEFGDTWKNMDDKIKNKYKKICQNKDFTKEKYNEIVKNK